MTRAVAVLLSGLLAACSTWPTGSYVQSINPADAGILAPAIADYLSGALPSGSAIALAPAQSDDPISAPLVVNLDRDGLIRTPSGVPVRYVASPLDGGVLLRISIGDREGASRYFARAATGIISPAGPLTVAQP